MGSLAHEANVFLLEKIRELENFNNNTEMETSREKQIPVSKRSFNLKSVD